MSTSKYLIDKVNLPPVFRLLPHYTNLLAPLAAITAYIRHTLQVTSAVGLKIGTKFLLFKYHNNNITRFTSKQYNVFLVRIVICYM